MDALKAALRQDDLSNVFTGLGQSDVDWRRGTSVSAPGLTQAQRDALYESNDLIARIIDTPADEAVSNWIELSGEEDSEDDPSGLDSDWAKTTTTALDEQLGLRSIAKEFLRRDAKDGGVFAILGVNDGSRDLSLPLGPTIETFRRIVFVDVERVVPGPVDSDYQSPEFGRPAYYDVSNIDSGRVVRIHASRCVSATGIQVSDKTRLRKKGWGASKLDRVAPVVVRYQRMWDHVDATSSKFSTTWLKIAGLADALVQGPEGERAIRKRLDTLYRSVSALKLGALDAEDELAQISVQYQGISQVIIEAREDVAAASGMPLTKLFGHAPGGLSTDDSSGRQNWAKVIGALQSDKLLPFLRKVIGLFLASKDGPTGGVVPNRYSIRFCPLDEPSEKEEAEAGLAAAQTDTLLVTSQVISPQEARTRLERDDDCPYDLDDSGETDDVQAEADAKDMLEMQQAAGAGAPGAPSAPNGAVQDTLPNGSQVESGLKIVKSVADGELPRDAGIGMLKVFYRFSPEEAETIMASVGAGFERVQPEPTVAQALPVP